MLTKKKPTGRIARLIIRLQEFKFKVQHISGSENILADALSRRIVSINESTKNECLKPVEIYFDSVIIKAHCDLGHASSGSTYNI